jgi:pyruvate/2-oxoglutarate dehydrogenase complex dihydrolipoamide dehydrogenase (E3) component
LKKDYDLLIIGGGSAGLTSARFASQLELTVALVEKGLLGGDCTWNGCVPSKTLLKAAKSAHAIRDAARFGITTAEPRIDFKSVMGRVGDVRQQIFESESPATLQSEGIDVIQGNAKFINPGAVSVDGREISARWFLVCTGAGPAIPPIEGLADVDFLTYETVWDLEELPLRLAVVSGGPIGCEMAQAFCALGSSVNLGGGCRPHHAARRARSLRSGCRTAHKQDGVDLRVNAAVQRVEKNIYAAGDYQFTHYAGYQGFMAVRNAFLPFN